MAVFKKVNELAHHFCIKTGTPGPIKMKLGCPAVPAKRGLGIEDRPGAFGTKRRPVGVDPVPTRVAEDDSPLVGRKMSAAQKTVMGIDEIAESLQKGF